MLTDVTIEGLRGVGKVELKFVPDQRAYVLFGANGIGKTKCLEALYQFLLASNKDFAKDFMAKQIGLPCNASVMTHMSNVPDGGLYELPGGGRYKFLQAWKGEIQLHGSPVVFLGAGQRASVNGMARQSAGLGSFEVRRKKYFNEIFQALDSGQLRALGMKDDTRTWFVARAQSANPYQKSKDDRSVEIDAVLAILHEIDPHVDSKVLRIDGDGRVFLSVDGQERELGELSSGYAALVKMVQAIIAGYAAFTNEVQLQNVRGIVLIDEIDAHLHPAWQARIVFCLKTLLPNTTFYIATHSPLVLVQLLNGEAYRLKRDDDGVVRNELIRHPGRRLFVDTLDDGFGIDLNKLKRDMMEHDDQTDAKRGLLDLLDQVEAMEKAEQ